MNIQNQNDITFENLLAEFLTFRMFSVEGRVKYIPILH